MVLQIHAFQRKARCYPPVVVTIFFRRLVSIVVSYYVLSKTGIVNGINYTIAGRYYQTFSLMYLFMMYLQQVVYL